MQHGGWRTSGRYGLVAVALGVGIALTGASPVAWADDAAGDGGGPARPAATQDRSDGPDSKSGSMGSGSTAPGSSAREASSEDTTAERTAPGSTAPRRDRSERKSTTSSRFGSREDNRPRDPLSRLKQIRARVQADQAEAKPTAAGQSSDRPGVAFRPPAVTDLVAAVTRPLDRVTAALVPRPGTEEPAAGGAAAEGAAPTGAEAPDRPLTGPAQGRLLRLVSEAADLPRELAALPRELAALPRELAALPRELAADAPRLSDLSEPRELAVDRQADLRPLLELVPRPLREVLDRPQVVASPRPALAVVPDPAVVPDTAAAPDPAAEDIPEPQPLSKIAKLAQAPARLINTVLQVLDLTVSENGPRSPFDWSPIDQAIFAVFREVEDLLGLSRTPAEQPTTTSLDYTCDDNDCTTKTPTVAQFLNASSAKYVLGGQPGDLKPFVVDGQQMQSTNTLSGMSGTAWVTPEGQVIIAYSGTTGGTNLLVNPVIAVTQILADVQVIVTRTTPWAFHDSLDFANEVRAEANKQGYADEDIFVTGHSLGAWEAQYVAQNTGLGGIGFEGPGLNTVNPGNNNGADSNFVNVLTYGDAAAYFSSDVPGLGPIMRIMPGGSNKPHYGNIVMIGDQEAAYPMINAAALLDRSPLFLPVVIIDVAVNFFQYHLPAVQAHHLGVSPDPGVVPWLGNPTGRVDEWGELTIPQLQAAAADEGRLFDNGAANRPAADPAAADPAAVDPAELAA